MVPPNHGLACTQTSDAGPPEVSVTVPLMLPPAASAGTAGAASTTPAASVAAAATPRTSRRMMPPPPAQRSGASGDAPASLPAGRAFDVRLALSCFCGGPGELGGSRRGG